MQHATMPDVLSVVLALAASVSWGVADFLGGLNTRQLRLAAVLLVSQTVGALLLVPLAALHGPPPLDAPRLAFACVGSVAGLIGIGGLYRGMAVGTVSIVAPISATGAAIPVLFGVLVRGERASPLQTLGIGLALLGVVLASRSAEDANERSRMNPGSGVGYALLAAVGFGAFFVFLHEAGAVDVLWASALQRVTGVVITLAIVVVTRTSMRLPRARLPSLALTGTLDTTANVLYAFASTTGLVSLAAMLASLYPVATVLLARVMLQERLSRVQTTGVVCALLGVMCIAAL